jgi:hypothetical protein
MGDQASHCGATRMFGAEALPQEDPERYQRRIDAVVPAEPDRFEDLCEALCGEDLGEGKTAFLKKLLSEEVDLPLKPTLGRMPHPWASLPMMSLLPYPIYAREALLPISVGRKAVREI